MPIAVDSYYQSSQSLNEIKEPYLEMLEQFENLYFKGPADSLDRLSYTGLKNYCVMSAAWTISQKLQKNMVPFVSTLLTYFDNVYLNTNSKSRDFRNFWVNQTYERAVIFGCVYYILSFEESFPQQHLQKIEGLIAEKDLPYFNVFKDAANRVLAQRQSASEDEQQEDIIQSNLDAGDGKRIILADRRGSDFTRIVQAMVEDGYFCHADKSEVTATEVGEMWLRFMGVATEWKSMLQKAFNRDKPLKTFDQLRDAAQSYWQKRANIHD